MPEERDPREWHGHRIVSEDDLVEGFSDGDPEHVNNPRYYRRRLLHGIVLGLLAAVLVAALVLAYLVKTRQIVIPAFEPAPTSAAPTTGAAAVCPQDVLKYSQPKDVTVNILNGTKTPGLAGATAKALKDRGFHVGEVGNAELSEPGIVGAVVSGASGRAKALTVQRAIPGTEYVTDKRRSADTVDFIIGNKFKYKAIVPAKAVDTRDGKLSCPLAEKKAKNDAGKPAPASTPARDDGGK